MNNRKALLLCLIPLMLSCANASSSPIATSSVAPATSSGTPTASSDAPASSSSPAASSSSSAAPKGDYLFYQLKEGATKDGLEGAPWVNSVKEGIAAKLVKPSLKDDFYLNKTYDMQINAKLEPGDIAVGGLPGAIKTISKRTTKMLTEETTSSYSSALRSVFSLFSKEDKSAEVAYVKGLIDEIKAISTLDALADYLCNKGYDSVWPLFEIVRTGAGKLLFKEENMGLTPSSVFYDYTSEGGENKQRVIDTSVYMLGLYGYSEEQAKAVLDSAANSYRDVTSKSFDQAIVSIKEIDDRFPYLKLKEYLSTKLGYSLNDEVTVSGGAYHLLSAISSAWNGAEGADLNLAQIKDSLIFRLAFISCISRGMSGENGFITLTQGLNSNTQGFNDDMHLKDIFATYFRDVYDRVYLDNYETKERRASIISLMNEVTAEYKALLNGSTWLDESTRKEAVEKLEAMTFDACYPVSLDSLPAWNFTVPTTFMEAVNNYSAWSRRAEQPVNPNYSLWAGTVTTINGVYSPITNSFVIYDGLLASDSYSTNMSKEELYGSIGAVIGHEISHAFDVSGAKYDKSGLASDWWTSKDKAAYEAKVNKIKNVWSQYENKPNMKLSCDEEMLGEIIADMGGVSVCLRLGAKQTNFDYDKFFTSYAAMHGSIMSEDALNNLIYGAMTGKQDPHPISTFRVNGVVNQFEKFYETYQVGENDKMYVAAADRLNIWG
ncbi:MAG: M13-type metalloendopeptidase [Bacilli bacterium]|nr:M13-type metalloendopeptidase [Bacilli bacterium]